MNFKIFMPLLMLSVCISEAHSNKLERSFLMIKPDGVQRGLVGDIIKRFEAKGFKLVAMKFMWVSN
jgi:nucleoside-diphosphate kinase